MALFSSSKAVTCIVSGGSSRVDPFGDREEEARSYPGIRHETIHVVSRIIVSVPLTHSQLLIMPRLHVLSVNAPDTLLNTAPSLPVFPVQYTNNKRLSLLHRTAREAWLLCISHAHLY